MPPRALRSGRRAAGEGLSGRSDPCNAGLRARDTITSEPSMSLEFLWYIPNTVESGHRGDDSAEGWGSLDFSAGIARALEEHGFGGALIGSGWGRTDTFTLATALAARTRAFKPLAAIRPGYWQPALFAC